jgi:hypothetical protein
MRLGGQPQQAQLSPRPIPKAPSPPSPKKAILAVAASILTAAYYLLRNQVPYRDLGALYFARLDQDRTIQRLANRIKQLGYEVKIQKAA